MEMNGFNWHHRPLPPTSDELVAAYKRYFEHVIDKFGPDRCMFESNFPVDMVSCSYTVLWNANKKMAKGASAKEKAALFHDTATRIYKL
jgi:L-fuconolactonase